MKNHVSAKAKRISAVLKNKFGYDVKDFDVAISGDIDFLRQLGEANNNAIIARENIPKVRDAILNIQKGTEEYNQAIAENINQGGKSAIATDSAMMSASLDNTRYINDRQEMAHEYVSGKAIEKQRHRHAIDYIKLKTIIAHKMAGVDNRAAIEGQINRPAMKQIGEDIAYNKRVAQHVFQFGDEEKYELLPAKDYEKATNPVVSKVKSFLGISV